MQLHVLTENVASPTQSCSRLSKFALHLAVRVAAAGTAGDAVSTPVFAECSVDIGHNDRRCVLSVLRLAVRFDRSLTTAGLIDDGLPTSITTTKLNAEMVNSKNNVAVQAVEIRS